MNCNYPKLIWSGQVCGQLSSDGTSYTFNPTICSNSTEYCQFVGFNSDSVCVSTNVVPVYDAYPGEKCTDMNRCASGTCEDGKCKPFPTCQNFYDCGAGHYCKQGTCVALVPVGSACYHTYECVTNASCDNVASGVLGTCRKLLSLPPGSYILNCNTRGKIGFGRNFVCESSYCYNFNGGYRCTESFQSVLKNYPQECTMGTQCYAEVDGVSGMAMSAPCQCGYNNNGQGYCPLRAGDPETQDFLNAWRGYLDSDELAQCNTISRRSYSQWKWCFSSSGYRHYWKMWYYVQRMNWYAQVVEADKCYLKFVANSYYLASVGYNSGTKLVLVFFTAVLVLV